jgi:hypothetical protein
MAKKTFKDLSGVKIKIKGYADERCRMYSYDEVEKITHEGDIFYMLDKDNNFEVVPVIAKEVRKYWRSRSIRYSRFIEDVKTFIPYSYTSDEKKVFSNDIISKIESFEYKGDRSHCGLFFSTEEEALEWQKKAREGKLFALLKKGDSVYCLSDKYADKPVELSFEKINIDNDGYYHIHFLNHGNILTGNTIWEDKTSDVFEPRFYSYQADLGDDVKLFVNEKDALKYLSDAEKRKKKNATDKYIASLQNHNGKPISFNDKRGKQLHYGDIVAYAVSCGSCSPYISMGKVSGESKTKISLTDLYCSEEKHSVCSGSVILIKEAEYDTKSGYSFVKEEKA